MQNWIKRYFAAEQIPEVMDLLSEYGTEDWHREENRVKRDVVIISKGSIEKLKAAITIAKNDYRDVLIGEQVDPWLISELKKYKS